MLTANEAPCSRFSMAVGSASVMSVWVSIAQRIPSRNASMRCDRRSPSPGLRRYHAGCVEHPHPAVCGGHANAELGRSAPRSTGSAGPPIRSSPSLCWPPTPASSLNQIRPKPGKNLDPLRSGSAPTDAGVGVQAGTVFAQSGGTFDRNNFVFQASKPCGVPTRSGTNVQNEHGERREQAI